MQALVAMSYGDLLNPDRYGPVTEFSEEDFKDSGRGRYDRKRGVRPHGEERHAPHGKRGHSGREGRSREFAGADFTRVYVGLGRRHGAGAREVAQLLMRAGGVPGRMVDEIEMKDYCSFATLPADAARRACVFSRNTGDPVIRAASDRT